MVLHYRSTVLNRNLDLIMLIPHVKPGHSLINKCLYDGVRISLAIRVGGLNLLTCRSWSLLSAGATPDYGGGMGDDPSGPTTLVSSPA